MTEQEYDQISKMTEQEFKAIPQDQQQEFNAAKQFAERQQVYLEGIIVGGKSVNEIPD